MSPIEFASIKKYNSIYNLMNTFDIKKEEMLKFTVLKEKDLEFKDHREILNSLFDLKTVTIVKGSDYPFNNSTDTFLTNLFEIKYNSLWKE